MLFRSQEQTGPAFPSAADIGPAVGPSGPPSGYNYESYPESPSYGPSVGPSRPPTDYSYESYPDAYPEESSVGPARPPVGYEYASYPEADDLGPMAGPSMPPQGYYHDASVEYSDGELDEEYDDREEMRARADQQEEQIEKPKPMVAAGFVGMVPTNLRVKRSLTQPRPPPAKVSSSQSPARLIPRSHML